MFRSLTSNLFRSNFLVANNVHGKNLRCVARNFSSSDSDSDFEKVPSRLENVDNLKCMNKVMLLGRAVGPVFFHSGNNTEMATFTLVTSEVRKNRSNELIKRSEFHKVQIFIPRLVNKARNVVQKGSRIFVEGKINYNVRRNEDGNQHFTNIIADNIIFFTGNREGLFANQENDVEQEENQHTSQ